jgi:hypothetical protein
MVNNMSEDNFKCYRSMSSRRYLKELRNICQRDENIETSILSFYIDKA